MTLCASMTPVLNEQSVAYYPGQSFHEFHRKLQRTLKGVLRDDSTTRVRLAERLGRRFSVQDVLSISTTTRPYSRTISLIENDSRCEQIEDFGFTTIPNDLEFLSFPEEEENETRHYSTKKPYPCPLKGHTLSSPPTGYKPISIQLLARHGSRSLNGHDYDIQILKVWQIAQEKNMLTPLGEQLKEDTELFMEANNRVGRGELTQLGKEEHFGLGTRLYHRLKCLFDSSNQISVMTSGKKRAMDSADEFVNGLTGSECDIAISKENPNKNLLYFHKSCSNYMSFKKTDAHVKAKLNLIKNSDQTKKYAQQVLRRIYQNDFVELIINGSIQIESEEKVINAVDIVSCLYSMFVVSLAQSQSRLTKMLVKYFNQEESSWFAYVNDAQEFYVKGPSIEGTTVTYDMAKPLLMDFFSSITNCIEARTNLIATLRFAHAETVIPFATLLQIPGLSDRAAHSLDLYTYENNQWRGDRIAPMAANIQWEIYQHENHPHQILVRMLYNEMEVRFKEDCQPFSSDSFFYDLNELKRAYASLLLPSSSNEN